MRLRQEAGLQPDYYESNVLFLPTCFSWESGPESLGLVKGSGYQGCMRTYPQVRDAEGPQSTSRVEGRTRLRVAA